MKNLLAVSLLALAVAVGAPAEAQARSTSATDSVVAIQAPPTVAYAVAQPTVSAQLLPSAARDSVVVTDLAPARERFGVALVSLLGLALMGSLRTVTADNDSKVSRDSVRQQLNKVTAWLYYSSRNRMISTTVAAFPGIAIATTTTKIKTTNATVALNAGANNAVGATDNAWTLTGGNLATGYSRKYLLLVDSADAFTVMASDDQASAANCTYSALPADGLAVLGSVTITNASGANFVPGTTALTGVSGLTVTYYDAFGDDGIFPFAQVNPN